MFPSISSGKISRSPSILGGYEWTTSDWRFKIYNRCNLKVNRWPFICKALNFCWNIYCIISQWNVKGSHSHSREKLNVESLRNLQEVIYPLISHQRKLWYQCIYHNNWCISIAGIMKFSYRTDFAFSPIICHLYTEENWDWVDSYVMLDRHICISIILCYLSYCVDSVTAYAGRVMT